MVLRLQVLPSPIPHSIPVGSSTNGSESDVDSSDNSTLDTAPSTVDTWNDKVLDKVDSTRAVEASQCCDDNFSVSPVSSNSYVLLS
jgi:hypothetical protein